MSKILPREFYEGTGGWNDGRLGQARDLIDSYLTEIGMVSGRHKILTMIEDLDAEQGL